jgi:hypothetical protein
MIPTQRWILPAALLVFAAGALAQGSRPPPGGQGGRGGGQPGYVGQPGHGGQPGYGRHPGYASPPGYGRPPAHYGSVHVGGRPPAPYYGGPRYYGYGYPRYYGYAYPRYYGYGYPGYYGYGASIYYGAALYPWAYPYGYGYGYGYGPSVVVTPPAAPTVYIERPAESAPLASGYWYYCANPQGYYPQVAECPSGWIQVLPRPAQ